ncbi:biotin-dependent carboxyltransferase family protein [Flavobacteriaceae bacterium 3-367]|uniref:5-oxoprolinase subunit C family protein n=1 Tax=Eudoraea algarum TaxID=3417568 RepID=UPI00327A04EB
MLKVLKSGFFTTVQDAGRYGLRDKGVPISGAMDMISAAMANRLLENTPDAALLEITMTGPTLEFEEDTYISLGGAEMSATLNNAPVQNYKVYKVRAGDLLSYGKLERGLRAYLAIKEGFRTPMVLGSRSLFKPLTPHACLSDKSEVPFNASKGFEPKIEELKVPPISEGGALEIFKGPEYEMLTDAHLAALFSKDFTVAKENNRMAYQLEETLVGHHMAMLTSATLPGTMQLTPAGKLIILMKDGQTTGGYPRIAQLSERSISVLAQKKFGDSLSFKLVLTL